jgi:hypothetical protein
MANGNGISLTPAKIIGICIAITVAANGWSLAITKEHASEIAALRQELNAKTDGRYRQSDASRDFKLVNFRFMHVEEKMQRCEEFIDEHRKDHGAKRKNTNLELADQRRAGITAVVAIIAALAALAVYWDGWTVSEVEAAQEHEKITQRFESYQAQQYRADKADRIDRFQREIDRIDFQQISDELTERQREYLTNKRRDIERKMTCVEKDDC